MKPEWLQLLRRMCGDTVLECQLLSEDHQTLLEIQAAGLVRFGPLYVRDSRTLFFITSRGRQVLREWDRSGVSAQGKGHDASEEVKASQSMGGNSE